MEGFDDGEGFGAAALGEEPAGGVGDFVGAGEDDEGCEALEGEGEAPGCGGVGGVACGEYLVLVFVDWEMECGWP